MAKRFIAAFYPDCKFAQTIVTGEVEGIEFKVTGKTILEPGWRTVYAKDQQNTDEDEAKKKEEERTLPIFEKGERKGRDMKKVQHVSCCQTVSPFFILMRFKAPLMPVGKNIVQITC